MCSSQTTQTTSIPGEGAFEQKMRAMFSTAILPQMIEESGYSLEQERVLSDDDAAFYTMYRNTDEFKTASHAELREGNPEAHKRYTELAKKLDAAGTTDPKGMAQSFRKTYSPDIEKLYQEQGPNSEAYLNAVEAQEQKQFAQKEAKQQIVNQFHENTMKFLKGDFSMTPEEKSSMEELFSPARQAVEQMYDQVGGEIDAYEKKITEQREMYDQVQQQLLEQGIEEYSDEATLNVMNQAAALGRDPADPEFSAQIGQMVAKEAGRAGLQLKTQQLLRGERQQADIFQKRLGVAEARGAAGVGIEDQIRNLRMGTLTGGGTLAGQSAGLVDAISQQRLANLGGLGAAVTGQQQLQAQQRMAQQTTTGTMKESPLSIGLGVASVGLGAYTGMEQASGMRSLANALG